MIDHVVVAVPHLEDAVAQLHTDWDAVAVAGGQHPAHGTHNALLALDGGQYVELLAVDPSFEGERSDRGRAVAGVHRPVLWEVLLALPAELPPQARQGRFFPDPRPGLRRNDDGSEVRWTIQPWIDSDGEPLPDLIAWHSKHPAAGLRPQAAIADIELDGPDGLEEALAAMYPHCSPDVARVRNGPGPSVALRTRRGTWTVRA